MADTSPEAGCYQGEAHHQSPLCVSPLHYFTIVILTRMLSRWIYISTSRLAATEVEERVKDIVEVSIARNRSLDVTGALLFTGCHFAQYLEGAPTAIEELKASISRDKRHEDVHTIASGDYTHRRFLTWSLAYAGPSQFVANIVERALTDALKKGEEASEALAQMLSEFSIGGRG